MFGILLLLIQGGIWDIIEWQFEKFKPVYYIHNFPDLIGINAKHNSMNAFISGVKAGFIPTIIGLIVYYFIGNLTVLNYISVIGLLIGIAFIFYHSYNENYTDIYLLHKIFYIIGISQFILSIVTSLWIKFQKN